MAFTFDLTSADYATHRRSQLRLLTGDRAESQGLRPGGGNFDDADLDALLALEDDNLHRAMALVFETLAAEWSAYAGEYRLGPESEASRQAAAYVGLAADARARYGYTLSDEDMAAQSGALVIDWTLAYRDWLGTDYLNWR